MKDKLLVTHSLLASWKWWIDYEGDDDIKARESFENSLKKIWVDNEDMKAGRDFEQMVEAYAKGTAVGIIVDKMIHECAVKIAEFVKRGTWQVSCKKDITIDDQPLLLYGRVDVLRGPDIFDIKFVKHYDARKYFKSTQHKMYFECLPDTERFTYLVSDGVNVFEEPYDRDEVESIIPVVNNWWSWINQFPKYLEIYKDKWKAF